MITLIQPKKRIILRYKSKRLDAIITDAGMIERLSGFGLNEKQIADFYNITYRQFNRAYSKNKALRESIERGRKKAAKSVMESLYNKAMGFERSETVYSSRNGTSSARTVTKYYPPDMKAIIFYLKNRCPMEWREKIDIEKGQYLVGEEEMAFLFKESAKRMKEMM
ncbi:MAG: hypothetical protein EHM58_11410 [Ignavibacteriae bacterium]|nr:MAG: hypothetical protein EHM58_11410 [Ignavibacteriota bacterium]